MLTSKEVSPEMLLASLQVVTLLAVQFNFISAAVDNRRQEEETLSGTGAFLIPEVNAAKRKIMC